MASIKKRPDGQYRARFRDHSGREHAKHFARKVDAQSWLDEQTAALVTGQFVDPKAGKITFKQFAEQWRKDQLHHRPATAKQCESRLRLWVYPRIGDRPMSTIRRSDVQRVVTLASEKLAAATVEVVYSYVAGVFKAAVVDKVVPSSPCVKIKLPEKTSTKIVPLTTEQVSVIAGKVDARYRAMVLLAAATGLRSGELRGLTIDRLSPALHLRSDVPPKRAVLRIDRQLDGVDENGEPVFAPPKTPAADRSVPVPGNVAVMLADHLAEYGPGAGGLVFSIGRRTPLERSRAGHLWRAAVDGMNLRPRSGWHDLRHYHASLLIADGLSPRAVADRLGHEDPAETLRTYAHLWESDEERAVTATETALRGVI